MFKIKKSHGVLIIISVFFLSSVVIYGQDLGSTTGIFRNTKTKAKEKPPAKKSSPSKPKSASNSAKRETRKTPPKNTPPASRETTRSAANKNTNRTPVNQNNPQTADKTPKPPKDIIITVGKPTSSEFEEIYEQALEEGNLARDRREYLKAEDAYRRAKNLKIKDFRAVYGLGNIYSDQQRWEEAEIAYREAIKLAPDSPEPYIAISFVLTQPISGKLLSSRFLEAQKMARRAIELDPTNPVAFDQLGVALELSGNIDGATLDAYKRAVALDPEFALAHAHLGRLLRRNGKTKESTEAYSKAIQFAADVPSMIMVAEVFQSQQRFNESEQLLRRALAEDSRNPTALYLYGRALIARSAYSEAETILKRSIEVSPQGFVSYALLGSLYSRRGEFKDAEKILNQALRVISENEKKRLAQEFETVGDGYLRTGKNKDAVRVYQQAFALDTGKVALNDKIAKARND